MEAVGFSRHARRRMKWRRISEEDVVAAIARPERQEVTRFERINFFARLGGRLLKVTALRSPDGWLVVSAVEKKGTQS
jgi:hypothetical protein